MTHWSDAGFGTDPEGDAARRAAMHRPAILTPPIPDDELPAYLGGHEAELPAGGSRDLVILDEPPDDGHAVTRTEYGSSVAIVCACGRWECIVTGPSSAAWAGRDYRRHVDDERRGASDA